MKEICETERIIKRMAELEQGIDECENSLTKYAIELNDCRARLRRINQEEISRQGVKL